MTTTTSKTPLQELKEQYDSLSAAERLAIREAFAAIANSNPHDGHEEDDDEPPFVA